MWAMCNHWPVQKASQAGEVEGLWVGGGKPTARSTAVPTEAGGCSPGLAYKAAGEWGLGIA